MRSSLWQRMLAAVLGLTFAFVAIVLIGDGALPQGFPVPHKGFDNRALGLASGIGLLCGSIWFWWRAERDRLRADERGVEQRVGLRCKRVAWSDVASFRQERTRGTRERLVEPVLYDSEGRVLLRPVAPALVGTGSQDEERARFWALVERRLHAEGARRQAV